MTKRSVPWLCALLFGLFHVLVVVSTLLATRGSGEGQAFLVALVDLPLVLLLQAIPRGGYILYDSPVAYIWFFSVVGTVFYAVIGYGLGALIKTLITFVMRIREKGEVT